MKKLILFFTVIFGLAVYLEKSGQTGGFEGSRVIGAGVAPDSSVFPALVSSQENAPTVVITTQPTIVYGIHITSGAAIDAGTQSGNYVIFFDTGALSTVAVSTRAVVEINRTVRYVQFNPPLRFYKGLSTRATSCTTSITGWCYSVVYDTLGTRVGP